MPCLLITLQFYPHYGQSLSYVNHQTLPRLRCCIAVRPTTCVQGGLVRCHPKSSIWILKANRDWIRTFSGLRSRKICPSSLLWAAFCKKRKPSCYIGDIAIWRSRSLLSRQRNDACLLPSARSWNECKGHVGSLCNCLECFVRLLSDLLNLPILRLLLFVELPFYTLVCSLFLAVSDLLLIVSAPLFLAFSSATPP